MQLDAISKLSQLHFSLHRTVKLFILAPSLNLITLPSLNWSCVLCSSYPEMQSIIFYKKSEVGTGKGFFPQNNVKCTKNCILTVKCTRICILTVTVIVQCRGGGLVKVAIRNMSRTRLGILTNQQCSQYNVALYVWNIS